MKFKLAIVEDEKKYADKLINMMNRYSLENNEFQFDIKYYQDGLAFLNEYDSSFDAIFLDIQMPSINGIEVARRIRKINENVMIIFVTNIASYALASYEVHAFDFILKSLDYESFYLKFKRICNTLKHNMKDVCISFTNRLGTKKLSISNIVYVEVSNHTIIFYLKDETFKMNGKMSDIEKRLKGYNFIRISASLLVNLHYINEIKGEAIMVEGKKLKVSRLRKPNLLDAFTKYVGGSI